MAKASEARRQAVAGDEALTDEERRTRALEDIAASMRSLRSTFVDISIWIAHIGRNMPTGRKQ